MDSNLNDLIARSNREQWGLRGAVKVFREQHLQPASAEAFPTPPELRVEFTAEGSTVGGRNFVPFSFDETGRKTRTHLARPDDYHPNRSFGGSPFSMADRRPNLPDGGAATTYYDERERPVEVLVRNSQKKLVSRARRIHDAEGRVLEESLTIDDPAAFLPASLKSHISSNESIKQWMAARAGTYSDRYFYDSKGRKICTLRQSLEDEEVLVSSYNDRDDVEIEITVNRPIAAASERQGTSYSEARYSYQYDEAGNWTEKIAVYRSSLEGPPSATITIRRILEYF